MNDSPSRQTSSRDSILARIRAGRPQACPLPDVPMFTVPGDPSDNLRQKLLSFDGQIVSTTSRDEAISWLESHIDKQSKKVYSAISGYHGNVDHEEVDADPHKASEVEICVAEGEYGVGETGSVWVTDRSLGLAACALLSTDLYLLLDHNRILPDMHRAYATIKPGSAQYGSFFTGPSATADIEAVHITGAQGEISLTVVLY